MEDTCPSQLTENVDQAVSRWENAWRLSRAIGLAIAVVATLWGKPFRPSPRFIYERACALQPYDPVRAERLFRTVVDDAGGDFPDAQLQLALRAVDRGESYELDEICESLKWDQVNLDLLMTFGGNALAAQRTDLARRSFEEMRRRDNRYTIAALRGLSVVHELEHHPEESLQCLEEITRVAPENLQFWRLLAEVRAARHQFAVAASAYRQALRLRPRRREAAEIRQRLIRLLVDAGDTAGAREELERLISSDDNLTPDIAMLVEQLDLSGAARGLPAAAGRRRD
jgi:tetratricopeptide (TPR) repeat protein